MTTTMKLIAKQTLSGSASSITFSSIPATYTDLLVLGSARSTATGPDNIRLRFNGASSDTNHSYRILLGNGSAASSASANYILVSAITGSNQTSNTFASFEVYIPNYAGSTNKSVSATGVQEANSSTVAETNIYVSAGLWSNTAAVTDLSFNCLGTGTFDISSSFYLYGITKA